jgi:hypothetical protein
VRALVVALAAASGCGFTPGSLAGQTGDDGMQTDDAAVADAGLGVVDAAIDAVPPQPTWVVIESITVPVNGNQVLSAVTLANGVAYRLRAEGEFVIQSPAGTPGDAEWWDYNNVIQDGVAGVDVGLAVNDTVVDTNRTPKWGAYQSSHIYEVDWTGNGQKLVAMLHDGNFANNTGSLTLKVLALQ